MAFPDDRLSTEPITDDWLSPDDLDRTWLEDWEQGPIAVSDTTEGLFYQAWKLEYNSGTGDFVITPQTTGPPVTVTNVANVTQCTFTFDQNANVTIAYTVGGEAKLYWFDTVLGQYDTRNFGSDMIFPSVALDDKRPRQANSSDMLLFYTEQQPDQTYTFFHRRQRDRFDDEIELKTGLATPYVYKFGMHKALRVQIALLAGITAPEAEFILLESGDYLLLEDGDRLMKE